MQSGLFFFCVFFLFSFLLPAYAEWVPSYEIPEEFRNLEIQSDLTIFFQGHKVGNAKAYIKGEYFKLKNISLRKLIDYGLKAEFITQVEHALHEEHLEKNERYLCLNDASKLLLTYKDICHPVVTKNIKIILNENNRHLYVFVNPDWVDTRHVYQPKYLPKSTNTFSYFANHHINKYSFKNNNNKTNSLNINQYAGMSFGNTLLSMNTFTHLKNNKTFGIQNLHALTYKQQGMYYDAGMLTLPATNDIEQRGMLGLLWGDSRNTINSKSSPGTPIVLNITSLSQVEIINTRNNNTIYVQNLHPGTQQIDTSNFLEGVYPITIYVRDNFGNVSRYQKLFIKHNDIPLVNQPHYDLGVGWLRKNNQRTNRSFYVPSYETSFPSLFGSMNFATNYNSAITVGLLNFKKNIVSSLKEDIYFDNYMITTTGIVSSAKSWGVGSLFSYLTHKSISFYSQFSKTHAGRDRYLDNDLQLSNYSALSWRYGNYNFSTNFGIDVDKRKKITPFYALSTNRFWHKTFENKSTAQANFNTGHSRSQRFYFTISWEYGYQIKESTIGLQGRLLQQNRRDSRTKNINTYLTGKTKFHTPNRSTTLLSTQVASPERHQSSIKYYNDTVRGETSFARERKDHISTSSAEIGVVGNKNSTSLTAPSLNDNTGVIVYVSADKEESYQVLVNEYPYFSGVTNKKQFVALAPFQDYKISIAPISAFHSMDVKTYYVTLYPGNIESISTEMTQKILVFTKLVDQTGSPIKEATYNDDFGNFAQSNEKGLIQFSLPENKDTVIFTLTDHKKCAVTIPENRKKSFLYFPQLVCVLLPQ